MKKLQQIVYPDFVSPMEKLLELFFFFLYYYPTHTFPIFIIYNPSYDPATGSRAGRGSKTQWNVATANLIPLTVEVEHGRGSKQNSSRRSRVQMSR